MEEFFDISKGYVSILDSLKIKKITNDEKEKMVEFVAIERMPSRFVNYKYEQYLQVDPTTYIGNKLFYSTRGSDYEKIIGLVPVDKNYDLRGTYYEKKNDTFVAKTLKTKHGKKRNLLVSRLNYSKGKDVDFDIHLNSLLFVYAAYRGKIQGINPHELHGHGGNNLVIYFPAQSENGNKAHGSDLKEVISDYYQQRYLPFELAKKTRLDIGYDDNNKAFFVILDENDKEIARIIDTHDLERYNIKVDDKGFFTISETISDYKRRSK